VSVFNLAINSSVLFWSEISATYPDASPNSFKIATALSTVSFLLPITVTWQPFTCNYLAVAKPMPLEPPNNNALFFIFLF